MNNLLVHPDEYYMRLALAEAEKAYEQGEIPIGAVVVLNGKVIGKGHNQTEKLVDVTAHAEIVAVTAAQIYLGAKFLSDCTVYVTVEPCVMCAGALRWARPGRVVWGVSEPKVGYRLFSPRILHPRTQISHGILEQECREWMQRFFRDKR